MRIWKHVFCLTVAVLMMSVASVAAPQSPHMPVRRSHEPATPDSTSVIYNQDGIEIGQTGLPALPTAADSLAVDSIFMTGKVVQPESPYDRWEESSAEYNPDPTRAVWMAALFPGLGQVYNRRYWKIPIVIGAYLGLGYATSWNNGMLNDYTRAYRDIMDNDPGTNSYMNFFPPTIQESDLDKTWLTNVLQSRKNFYRRNRDLCIIGMVGVYLIAMVDAYVDASLSHFDISPDLSMDVSPAIFQEARGMKPAVGLNWAINF